MIPEPFHKSAAFQKGFYISLAVNVAGLVFACSIMSLGFVGAGMSSSTPEDLREIWYSFVWTAFCCPTVLNLGLLAFNAFEWARHKDARIWPGWLAGLALVGIPLCLLAVFSVLVGGV
ncbi:MAG: hypothetical protein CVU44_05090 [Chloroflexi bacterium HGW-Chloroflexi-6]|nr:MAG: hypothetical protein CVU44_05090 [Chloroflexi bacterium HGW-Chloroflexi-6]